MVTNYSPHHYGHESFILRITPLNKEKILCIINFKLIDSSRTHVQSLILSTYVGVYVGGQRVHKHMSNKEAEWNLNSLQQANASTENNCQNSLQVSTHANAKTTMPSGSILLSTATTPITLRYNYNWEEPGVLAIEFSYGDLASILRHLNKPNLASTNIQLHARLEDRSGNIITVQLPFPRQVRYKSYNELMQMHSRVNEA